MYSSIEYMFVKPNLKRFKTNTEQLQSANISHLMHLELCMIEFVCIIPKGFWMERSLTQLAVKILFYESTGINK